MAARRHASFPPAAAGIFRRRRGRAGSVLIIVMITLIFTTLALVAFMDKASNDLLVEHRDAVTRRLRREAYSALEVTLAVLEDFRLVGNGLHSTAEGWGDPLAFAGYKPTEDRLVEISFEDESAKISLPRASPTTLTGLFKNWGITQVDADELTDALMGWMQKDHISSTGILPDYEQSSLPYQPPLRPLRSYAELAAIEKAREMFFDTDGRPNEFWKRFVDSVSLFNFARPNINGAKPDTLAALGQFDETQQQNLTDYLKGTGNYQTQGPQFFENNADAARITGPSGDAGAFGATIAALRVNIVVHEGKSIYRLAAVVTPQGGGASITQTTATAQRAVANAPAQQPTQPAAQAPNPAANQNAAAQNLRYPFTLLEIRENDEIPPAPSPPEQPK